MNKNKNARLRELLNQPGLLGIPGAYDAYSARIIQNVGFPVCYMGGNSTGASKLGRPDIGLTTMTEMVENTRNIAGCIDIPLICDADTGYGDKSSVWLCVREFEAAGASGVHIEDQAMPKRCGAMGGVVLESPEAMCEKIEAALRARQDPNFLIIARSDCYRSTSYKELIKRSLMYEQAGAEMLMPIGLHDPKLMKRFTSTVHVPVLIDICEFDKSRYIFSDQELEDLGFKVCLRPVSAILFAGKQLQRLYQHYFEFGSTKALFEEEQFLNRTEYEGLLQWP